MPWKKWNPAVFVNPKGTHLGNRKGTHPLGWRLPSLRSFGEPVGLSVEEKNVGMMGKAVE